jgi:kinetochore protein NDC80
MLAMFDWMVNLCKVRQLHMGKYSSAQAQENWSDPNFVSDPLLRPASELPVEHPRIEDRLLWDYCSRAYTEWCDGAEQFPQAERELREAYGE